MREEETCGKTAETCVTTVETFGKIAATFARTVETFKMIGKISGRIFNQERVRDRSHKIGETFAKTGGISGKIIGISGMIAKTGVETGETYGTTWPAAKATDVKRPYGQEKPAATEVVAGFVLQRNRSIQVFRLRTLPPKHLQPIYLHGLSHSPFIDLDHVGPGGDRRERRNRHTTFRRDIVQPSLKPLPSCVVFGA